MSFIKKLVSGDKIRFEVEKYNLDMCYVSQKIIAMAFPASGLASKYRNNCVEVKKYLDENHPSHYRVFNLSEEPYHNSVFDGNIENYPFPDHHAPPFQLLIKMLDSMHNFLSADPHNIVAVHCIAGLGRTGTICSCMLMVEGVERTAQQALLHFASIRSGNGKGVSFPSQIRTVYYFEEYLKRGYSIQNLPLDIPEIIIKKVTIIEAKNGKSYKPMAVIFDSEYNPIYNTSWMEAPELSNIGNFSYLMHVPVKGSFTLKFYMGGKGNNAEPLFYTTHNTMFIDRPQMILKKPELDLAFRDKTISDNLAVAFDFQLSQ